MGQIRSVALLEAPARRALYRFVCLRRNPVSRDQAAEAMGMNRALAAFHLDKLVDGGLLQATYRRISGRSGPGAGRPAKLYLRSTQRIALTFPPRNYELIARVGVAVLQGPATALKAEADSTARTWGRRWGADALSRLGARPTRRGRIDALTGVLETQGFEPRVDPAGNIWLANCPFAELAGEGGELICQLNVALIRGLVEGVQLGGVEAILAPGPDTCCVALRREGGAESLQEPAARSSPAVR